MTSEFFLSGIITEDKCCIHVIINNNEVISLDYEQGSIEDSDPFIMIEYLEENITPIRKNDVTTHLNGFAFI